jgi:pantothenate kinase
MSGSTGSDGAAAASSGVSQALGSARGRRRPAPPEAPFYPQELAGRARALAERAGRRVILGITGAPGAGKSTIAAALEAVLGPSACVIPMDGFHLSNAVLRSLGRATRKGAPDTFDADGYAALLSRLRQDHGRAVYAPSFDRELDEPVANDLVVPPVVRIVITEGNYLLSQGKGWDRVRRLLDEVWYVDADPAVRLQRLITRHERFGKDAEHAHAWATGPDEANARLITAGRNTASLVIRY